MAMGAADLLCGVMIALSSLALLLGLLRWRAATVLVLAGEGVMLFAMVDVCLGGQAVLPAVAWAGILLLLALATGLRDRLARTRAGGQAADGEAAGGGRSRCPASSTPDPCHPMGLILAAGMLVFAGAGEGVVAVSAAHGHGGGPMVLPVLAGVVAYAVIVGRGVRPLLAQGEALRVEAGRRLSSLGGLSAMGLMAIAGGALVA